MPRSAQALRQKQRSVAAGTRHDGGGGSSVTGRNRLTWLPFGISALIVAVAACGPAGVVPPTSTPVAAILAPSSTPAVTALDTGPVNAVTAAYQAAVAAGLTAQLGFFACLYGGAEANQFSDTFAGLSLLALISSGVSPDEFTAAFGTSFDGFQAVEQSRSADSAVVHMSVRVTLTPDVNKLREMMRRGLTASGSEFDEAAIDALLNNFISSAHLARTIEHDVVVTRNGGSWLVCAP